MGAWRWSVAALVLAIALVIPCATATVENFTSSDAWQVPAGVFVVIVEVWGGGAAGGGDTTSGDPGGSGGGGGAYARSTIAVTPSDNHTITVGAGGTGGTGTGGPGTDSWFSSTSTVLAKGGSGGAANGGSPGAGGSAASSVGDVTFAGGGGATGGATGGGGGSSAGDAATGTTATGQAGGTAPTGGGDGGAGGTSGTDGTIGVAPGGAGGGSGGRSGGSESGGSGAGGLVRLTYTVNSPASVAANITDSPDPATSQVGINYTATATDSDGDAYSLTVCRTNSISHAYPGTCDSGQQLCSVSAVSSGSQARCSYVPPESDVGTLTAYGFVCDAGTQTCVSASSTTTGVLSTAPNINSLVVSPMPAPNGTQVTVSVNVTDPDGVAAVFAPVHYPNGTLWQNISLSQSGDIWSGTFTSPAFPLGNHTVSIWANETNGVSLTDETSQFIPYMALPSSAAIAIDGSFSDWSGVASVSDPSGDAGAGGGGDSEILKVTNTTLTILDYDSELGQYTTLATLDVSGDYFLGVSTSGIAQAAASADIIPSRDGVEIAITGRNSSSLAGETWIYGYDPVNDNFSKLAELDLPGNEWGVRVADVVTTNDVDELIIDARTTGTNIHIFAWNETQQAFINVQNITQTGSSEDDNYDIGIWDANEDGVLDIVVEASTASNALKVISGDTFTEITTLALDTNGIHDDFDTYQGESDVSDWLFATGSGGTIAVWESGTYALTEMAVSAGNLQSLAAGDFNNDGCADVAASDANGAAPPEVHFYEGDCNGAWTNVQNFSRGSTDMAINIGRFRSDDVDGDGYDELYLAEHNNSGTVQTAIHVYKYNASAPAGSRYYWEGRLATELHPGSAAPTGIELANFDLDGSGGGPAADLESLYLTRNDSHVFSRIDVDGNVSLDGLSYRLFLNTAAATGNSSTPEGAPLPFAYDFLAKVNGTCTVLNSAGAVVGSCTSASALGSLELSVQLSLLNLSSGDSFNASWESAGDSRADIAPDASSFVESSSAGSSTASMLSPASGTSIDRDGTTADPDTVLLVASLSDAASAVSVSFFADLTDPVVAGHSDIPLGTNSSNSSGHAVLWWDATNSTGDKVLAGNYTVRPEASGYGLGASRYLHVIGSFDVSFRNASANPLLSYSAEDPAWVHATLLSMGPETEALLNDTYGVNVSANVTKPNAAVSFLQLLLV